MQHRLPETHSLPNTQLTASCQNMELLSLGPLPRCPATPGPRDLSPIKLVASLLLIITSMRHKTSSTASPRENPQDLQSRDRWESRGKGGSSPTVQLPPPCPQSQSPSDATYFSVKLQGSRGGRSEVESTRVEASSEMKDQRAFWVKTNPKRKESQVDKRGCETNPQQRYAPLPPPHNNLFVLREEGP